MTSSLAAGKTASIAIRAKTAYRPWLPMKEVTVPETLATSIGGAYPRVTATDWLRSTVPSSFVAVTRRRYWPAVARTPFASRPFQRTFVGPGWRLARKSVRTTAPDPSSSVTCTFAGCASVNDAARFEPLRVTTAAEGAVRKPRVVLSENGRSAVDVLPWSSVAVTEKRQAPSGAGVPSGLLPSQSNR